MWTVHTGTYSRRYPYWVGDGGRGLRTADGISTRKFATAQTAQAAADKMNKRDYQSREVKSACYCIQTAIQQLTRATRDSQPDDPRIAAAQKLFDVLQTIKMPS